jgi:acetolactate synthase-1/2/3 large subunit
MVSRGGKGAIPDGHANFYGSVSRGKGRLAQELGAADVVLVVGSRLTIGRPSNDVKLIQIDADAHEIALRKDDTLALVGDAKATLSRLSDALDDTNAAKRSSPAERVAAAREHLKGPEEHFEPQHTLTMAIRDGFPDDGIAIFGVTQLGYYSRPNWPVHEPGTYIDSGYSENLGFAFPTAIGAKVAQPDKPVICITGDGGFGYHTPELSTAVKYGINLVTVVFNDGHYGNVARDLDMDFGGQYEVDLVNPDYMELAHAYGAAGIRCDDHTKLSSAVADAVQMDRPVLLEVPVERMPRPSAPEDRPVWTKPQS